MIKGWFSQYDFPLVSVQQGIIKSIIIDNFFNIIIIIMIDQQEKYLEDAKKIVKEQAYFMKKALDNASLRDALKYANAMLSQLTTSLLSPKNYYILFMQIFDELKILQTYFKQEFRRGRKMIDLYQAVQHAIKIIPRLYLLITVGCVFIQSHQEGSEKVLDDLIQMLKVIFIHQAIQNPLRGLFIRYYFLKMCKDRLPDIGSQYQSPTYSIKEAFDIIFTNLQQSNRLWIKLQTGKDKNKKEKQRMDLKVLIGQNIHRISSLEGVNIKFYKNEVLPKLIELIKSCKDPISQQFLMDCIIQAFPDQFHIECLEELLSTCTSKLQPQVDIKIIFINLMDRLAEYSSQASPPTPIYNMFQTNITSLINSSQQFQFMNVLNLLKAFLKFSLKCYPGNTQYINQILKSCVKVCENKQQKLIEEEMIVASYLTLTMGGLGVSVLSMNEFPNLMRYLSFEKKKEVAFDICKIILKHNAPLQNVNIVKQLLTFVLPLIQTINKNEEITLPMEKQQKILARLVHLVQHENLQVAIQIIKLLAQEFKKGGQKRMKFTIPACIFRILKYLRGFENKKKIIEQVYQLMKSIKIHARLFINLSLQVALSIAKEDEEKKFDDITYEIMSQAMVVYQEEIIESGVDVLENLIGVLINLTNLSQENYDTLASNITKFSSKLLKKNDQCLMLLKCLHLFFNDHYKQQNRLNEILKKFKKIAENLMLQSSQNIYVYIYMLDSILFFSRYIQIKITQQVINIIKQNNMHVKQNDKWLKKIIAGLKLKQEEGLFQQIQF